MSSSRVYNIGYGRGPVHCGFGEDRGRGESGRLSIKFSIVSGSIQHLSRELCYYHPEKYIGRVSAGEVEQNVVRNLTS